MQALKNSCYPAYFQQMLRLIPSARHSNILSIIAQEPIKKIGRQIGDHLKGLKEGQHPFDHPLFQESAISYGALSALQEGHIGMPQFVTHQTHKALSSQLKRYGHVTRFIPLSDPEAKRCIEKTMEIKSAARALVLTKIKAQMDTEQIEQLLNRMQERPLSERAIFVYPDISDKTGKTITHALTHAGFNALMNDPLYSFRMLPSHSLVEDFLHVKFKGLQMLFSPRIGEISAKTMVAMQWNGSRPFNVPFEEFDPQVADHRPAPGADFYGHDFYHVSIASTYGSQLIRAHLTMAQFIENFANNVQSSYLEDYLQSIYDQLIDMEMAILRPEIRISEHLYTGKETREELFWFSWSSIFIYTFSSCNSEEEILKVIKILERTSFFDLLTTEMLSNPQWHALGLDEQGFINALKRLNQLNHFIRHHSAFEDLDYNFQQELHFFKKGLHPLQILKFYLTKKM